MNSLLYYYNNVQKMAAYRQAKRMQRGALTAQGGFSTKDPALLQVPCTIQCVFVPKNVISAQQTPFTTSTGGGVRIDLRNGSMIIYMGSATAPYVQPYEIDNVYNIVFSVSPDKVNLYVNGELKKALVVDTSQFYIYRIGHFNFNANFQGDYLLHRHFNYALSDDEVKALYNNGDPMGYVVPKAMRSLMVLENFKFSPSPLYGLSRTWNEDTSTNTEENNAFRVQWFENVPLYRPLKVTVTVSDYEAGIIYFDDAFSGYNTQSNPIRENGTFVFTTTPNEFIYGRCWCKNEGSGCKCTVTVDSVEVVGLLAEYLPQNLMFGRDDKTIATSWLDSAKQLPLSDEYLEPLFQSIGGYDMTANGAPEILYNE